jgi:predicted DNA-binding transcriptional regulator AlpA
MAQLCESLNVCDDTIRNWMRRHGFPRPRLVGGRRYWVLAEVAAYIEAQRQGGPSDDARP